MKPHLRTKLLRSHMLIACIGAALLSVALVMIVWLRTHIDRLVETYVPAVRAALTTRNGVERSHAGLRGWVVLGDDAYRRNRIEAWRTEIDVGVAELDRIIHATGRSRQFRTINALRSHLAELREVQWWVEDTAQAVGNEPARDILVRYIQPIADEVYDVITALIDREKQASSRSGNHSLLGHMADFRGFFIKSQAVFIDYVNTGSATDKLEFRRLVEIVSSTTAAISAESTTLDADVQEQIRWLASETQAIRSLSEEAIEIRDADTWNVARYMLKADVGTLEQEIHDLLNALNDSQLKLMNREVRQVTAMSDMVVTSLIVLIIVNLVAAAVVGRRRAHRIVKPVSDLLDATRRLADDRLKHDIPVAGSDELAQLAASFNRMRRSLDKSRISLEAAQEQFRVVVEAAPNALVVLDPSQCIIFVNPQCERLFGSDRGALVGTVVDRIIPGFARMIRGDEVDHLEGVYRTDRRGRRADGTELSLETAVTPINFHGQPSVLVAIMDITERRKATEQLRRYAAELQRSNRDLEQYANAASHDLKAPLTALDNLAMWIGDELGDDLRDPLGKYLQLMRSRIRRMQTLLSDLLAYSQVGRGGVVEDDVVDLDEMVKCIWEDVKRSAEAQLVITSRMPVIKTSRSLLTMVLQNLIENAVKHNPNAEKIVEVNVDDLEDYYRMTVSDDGPGIDKAYYKKAVTMFQTLRPRDEIEGSGIGLAVVKKIVESRGGSLTLDNSKKNWFRAIFTWPKSPPEPPPTAIT